MYSYFRESFTGEEGIYSSYSVVSPTGFTVHDVSPDIGFVKNLVERFNQRELSERNLLDAIEEAIC